MASDVLPRRRDRPAAFLVVLPLLVFVVGCTSGSYAPRKGPTPEPTPTAPLGPPTALLQFYACPNVGDCSVAGNAFLVNGTCVQGPGVTPSAMYTTTFVLASSMTYAVTWCDPDCVTNCADLGEFDTPEYFPEDGLWYPGMALVCDPPDGCRPPPADEFP